jgi:uncharacterized protein (TIGR02001 family)
MNRSKIVVCGMVAVLGVCTVGLAEEPSIEATADFFSKYVWRGQNVTDDWVFQPGVSASFDGATLGFWGSLDLTDENDESGNFIEYDWYADYSADIAEGVGMSIGAIYYYFPGGEATTEVYAGLSFDTVASPSVTIYYDVDEVEGAYVAFGLGHSIELGEDAPFGIDLGANLGWGDSSYNEVYWGDDIDAELNDLTLTAAFPFEVGPVSVTPSVAYVSLLGSDISDVADDDSLFYGGVGLAYAF